jgi:hypothetical protein
LDCIVAECTTIVSLIVFTLSMIVMRVVWRCPGASTFTGQGTIFIKENSSPW